MDRGPGEMLGPAPGGFGVEPADRAQSPVSVEEVVDIRRAQEMKLQARPGGQSVEDGLEHRGHARVGAGLGVQGEHEAHRFHRVLAVAA
jgi:hypothetical protein